MNKHSFPRSNTTTVAETYFFASCKSWHRQFFESIVRDCPANWIYVSSNVELEKALSSSKPRYIFFLHWNWMVPETIWNANECVCFHMTDVPYGRGGSPLQNLILAGHTQTVLTALRMVEEMDAGPVYTKKPLSLHGSAEEIYIRAGRLSVEIIKWMIREKPQPIPQEGEAFLFKRRRPEESNLPTEGDLTAAYDFIRMLDAEGYPKAFIEYGSYVIRFRKAKLDSGKVTAEVEINLRNSI
ncbi:hypothetical protein N5J70_04170 [Pseudomonas sp. GD03909]|nr:hypothetical protein [Pseudomonas sp. GD03909]